MFGLIKLLLFLAFVAVFVWFGRTVKIGKYTLFGHVERIWRTEEAQDLVEGAKESAGPAVDKLKRGVKAGVREMERPDEAPGKGDAQGATADPADAGPVDRPKSGGGKAPRPGRASK
jgi:hypothetical protein